MPRNQELHEQGDPTSPITTPEHGRYLMSLDPPLTEELVAVIARTIKAIYAKADARCAANPSDARMARHVAGL